MCNILPVVLAVTLAVDFELFSVEIGRKAHLHLLLLLVQLHRPMGIKSSQIDD